MALTGRPRNLQEFYDAMTGGGRGFQETIGPFLDEFRSNPTSEALATPPPARLASYWGTFFAAMVEILAVEQGLEIPAWVHEPVYKLDWPWCDEAENAPGLTRKQRTDLQVMIEAQTPEPFLRRGILIRASALKRV